MTRRRPRPADRNPAAPVTDSAAAPDGQRSFDAMTVAAVAWLVVVFAAYFVVTPANNAQVSRLEILAQSPYLLLDLVDPPATENAPPSGWRYLPQRFVPLSIAGTIWLAAWCIGRLALRRLRPPWLENAPLERNALACALGLAGWSLITLGCGLAGGLSRALFGSLIAAVVLAEFTLSILERRRIARVAAPQSADATASDRRWFFYGSLAASPFLLAMLLGSLLPSTDFDVNEYHLQGPKEWFLSGRIAFLPHNVYTSFPFLTEMLSLLAMTLRGDWFDGALAGKCVLMGFAPLTAALLFAAGRRWVGTTAGTIAALIYLSTPWVYRYSTIAYVEGALACYLFATFVAVARTIESLVNRNDDAETESTPLPETVPSNASPASDSTAPLDRTGGQAASGTPPGRAAVSTLGSVRFPLSAFRFRSALLCGLLAGSAMACKYPGLVSVVIPLGLALVATPFALRARRPSQRRDSLRMAGGFALGAAIAIGPWLAKNVAQTGNPVYPLAYSLFGGADWDADLDAKWRAGHRVPNYAPSDFASRLVEIGLSSDWQSPLPFALAPLAWLALDDRRRPLVRAGWGFVAFLMLQWWLLTHRIDRFWVPMLPVVALLAGIGATWSRSRGWTGAVVVALAVALPFDLVIATSGLSGYDAYLVDLSYARDWAFSFNVPGLKWVDERLPPGSKVLLVGEAMVFDADFPLAYNTVFDRCLFEEWAADPQRPESLRPLDAIRRTFDEQGVTHVFVNWQELLRYRTTYGYVDFVRPQPFRALHSQGFLQPPQSLGTIDASSLTAAAAQTLASRLPATVTLDDGRPVFVTGLRSGFGDRERAEIANWAPDLLGRWNGHDVFVTHQLFARTDAAGQAPGGNGFRSSSR